VLSNLVSKAYKWFILNKQGFYNLWLLLQSIFLILIFYMAFCQTKYYFSDTVLLCQDDPNRYSYLIGISFESIEDLKLRLEDLKSRSPWHEHMVEKTSKGYDAATREARKDYFFSKREKN
jgi:hypothetical protein